MDRGVWKLAIHVPEARVDREILWVSPLAYPNLFGTKDFVVVVVTSGWRKYTSRKVFVYITKNVQLQQIM